MPLGFAPIKDEIDPVDDRNALVVELMPNVRRLAAKLFKKVPACVDYDDLVSRGTLGLIEAIEKFDPTRGVKIETYIQPRIVGAMLDGMRADDWVPRIARRRSKEVAKFRVHFRQQNNRNPTINEVAEGTKLDAKKVLELDREVHTPVSIDATIHESDYGVLAGHDLLSDPFFDEEQVDQEHFWHCILKGLSEREAYFLTSYYREGMTMKQIGQRLDLSESRISQMRSQLIDRLREKHVVEDLI